MVLEYDGNTTTQSSRVQTEINPMVNARRCKKHGPSIRRSTSKLDIAKCSERVVSSGVIECHIYTHTQMFSSQLKLYIYIHIYMYI